MSKQGMKPEILDLIKRLDEGDVHAVREALNYVPLAKDDRKLFKTCDFHLAPEKP